MMPTKYMIVNTVTGQSELTRLVITDKDTACELADRFARIMGGAVVFAVIEMREVHNTSQTLIAPTGGIAPDRRQ